MGYRLGICLAVACVLAGAGCTHDEPQPYADIAREEAARQARELLTSLPPPDEEWLADRGRPRYVVTFQSVNEAGAEAWLSLFRFPRVEDHACVWTWSTPGKPEPHAFEVVGSLADGRATDIGHERCVSEFSRRKLLQPRDAVVGTDYPRPSLVEPPVVSALGFGWPGGGLREVFADTGSFLSDVGVRAPVASAPGTTGVVGRITAGDSAFGISGATVSFTPSTVVSGLAGIRNEAGPPVVTLRTVRDGFFSVLDLPLQPLGWDVTVRAEGRGPLKLIHVLMDDAEGETWLWEFPLGREPAFENHLPLRSDVVGG